MHEDDRQLVHRLISHDGPAFRAFFDDYFPRLFRFIFRRVDGDEEAARDIVQAALIRGVRRLETYRGEATLFTWLCQIARRELADHVAKAVRQETYFRRLVDLEDDALARASLESITSASDAEPEAVRQREDVAALVHVALDYLPRHYAEVLELKYLEDLSVEAIATRLGVTAIAVQSLLARARAAFRDVARTLLPSLDGVGLLTPVRTGPGGAQ